MKRIEHIYPSWCVKNDGSQLFKDTVIKYINTNYINTKYSGDMINSYYGIDKYNKTLSNENVNNFVKELTLEEFIKLTEIKMKYFKLNQTVYHPTYGEGKVISTNHGFMDCPILVQFKNTSVSFTEEGRDYLSKLIVLSQTPIPEIVNKPLEDEYIPFTWEDRELLKGKWIKHKKRKEEYLINYFDNAGIKINDEYFIYSDLYTYYEFVDGKPCGKLVN